MHNGRNRIASKRTASPRATGSRIAKPASGASPREAVAASPARAQPQKSDGKAANPAKAKQSKQSEIASRRKQAVSTKHRAAGQHKRRAPGKSPPPATKHSPPLSSRATSAEATEIATQHATQAGDPPATPPQTHATQEPDLPFFAPALPLSRSSEPLVSPPPAARPAYQPLPRGKALSAPQIGLWEAIGNWLHSAGRLLALGFIVKRRRPRPSGFVPAAKLRSAERSPNSRASRQAPQPSLRERTELIQLQAENRRLRQQLERMSAKTAQPASAPLSAKPDASLFPEPAREGAPDPDGAPLQHTPPAEPARAG